MATVCERKLKDGSSTWQVKIRRVGLKNFSKSFISKLKAVSWVEKNEQKFIKNPDKHVLYKDRLSEMREREFARKKEKGTRK